MPQTKVPRPSYRYLIGRAELAQRLGLGRTAKTLQRHRVRLESGSPPLPPPVPGEPREVWDSAAIDAYIAARSGYSLATEKTDREAARLEADREELRLRLPLLRNFVSNRGKRRQR